MHLGNGAITPECAVVAFGAAAAGLTIAAVAARRELVSRHKLLEAAGLGALVFAAQAVNVPILPFSSAHLVGGVLLAWALGPGLGAWVMAIVLTVQALALGDGGVMELGANVLNMALLPAALVAAGKQSEVATNRWSWMRCGVLAGLSVPLAALMIVGQTALFRPSSDPSGWIDFAVQMIGQHLVVGPAEGGLTIVLLAAVAGLKKAEQRSWRPIWVSLCLAALLGLASRWSSPLPDGYESSAEQARMSWILNSAPADSP